MVTSCHGIGSPQAWTYYWGKSSIFPHCFVPKEERAQWEVTSDMLSQGKFIILFVQFDSSLIIKANSFCKNRHMTSTSTYSSIWQIPTQNVVCLGPWDRDTGIRDGQGKDRDEPVTYTRPVAEQTWEWIFSRIRELLELKAMEELQIKLTAQKGSENSSQLLYLREVSWQRKPRGRQWRSQGGLVTRQIGEVAL